MHTIQFAITWDSRIAPAVKYQNGIPSTFGEPPCHWRHKQSANVQNALESLLNCAFVCVVDFVDHAIHQAGLLLVNLGF